MYKALYRKYRPVDFDSVVGQDSVVKVLKNSIKNNNISHAYMFFGPRGIGKTTLSKIFARAVNCIEPIDGNPCGKCENCIRSIDSVDIIEMDAASNNGVDEIRNIIDKISLVPTELKYKIYIIDEVHMLSIGAFNALLKTLEEPPQHVIFILATTDWQKVPETIVSRCQTFSLKRLTVDQITDRLKYVCNKEKIDCDNLVLSEIAKSSEGGMRDSLGMLDKLTSYTSQKITLDDYYELNGMISNMELEEMTNFIFNNDIANLMIKLNDFNNKNKNISLVYKQYVDFLQNILVDNYIEKRNVKYNINLIEKLLLYLSENTINVERSSSQKVYFEMLLIKYIKSNIVESDKKIVYNVISENDNKSVSNSLDNPIKKENTVVDKNIDSDKKAEINKNNIKNNSNHKKNILNINDIMRARINNLMIDANKKILLDMKEKLTNKSFENDLKYSFLDSSIKDSVLRVASNDTLLFSFKTQGLLRNVLNNILELNELFNDKYNCNFKFAFISDSEWNILKNKYIELKNQNLNFDRMIEPDVEYEINSDIINNNPMQLFGNEIVEEID